jgi:hypothetical protein
MKPRDASLGFAILLASGLVATACDPDSVPDAANEASVTVEVGPDATGVVVVALGGEPDVATLESIADTIDGDVFSRPATTNVEGNGGGIPLLEFTSNGAFEPGEAATIDVDTRRLCDDLMASGITELDVRLVLPSVDAELSVLPDRSDSSTMWHVRACSDAPHGSVVLRPDPGEFWRDLLLLAVVVVANMTLAVIGLRGISVPRWATIGLSAAAVAASFIVIADVGARAGDNMEVAGRMGHGANQVYFVASLVIVLLGPIAAVAQPFYWRLPRDERPRLRRRAAAPQDT